MLAPAGGKTHVAIHGAGTPDPARAPGNPEATPGSPEDAGHDLEWYRTQYEQIRPEYTRATQARSEAEERASQYEALFETLANDPDQGREILAELGYDFETDTGNPGQGDDEFVDPLEEEVRQLKELAETLQTEREQEAQSAEEAELLDLRNEYIDNAVEYIKSQDGTPDLTDDEQEVLGNLAIVMADDEGVPDVVGAFNRLYGEQGILETNRSRWIDTKNGAIPAPLGHSGGSDKRPTNRRERVAYLDARMRALDAQQ